MLCLSGRNSLTAGVVGQNACALLNVINWIEYSEENKEWGNSELLLPSILIYLITNWSHFTPGINMPIDISPLRLDEWEIRSHFPILYGNKHTHHRDKQIQIQKWTSSYSTTPKMLYYICKTLHLTSVKCCLLKFGVHHEIRWNSVFKQLLAERCS